MQKVHEKCAHEVIGLGYGPHALETTLSSVHLKFGYSLLCVVSTIHFSKVIIPFRSKIECLLMKLKIIAKVCIQSDTVVAILK